MRQFLGLNSLQQQKNFFKARWLLWLVASAVVALPIMQLAEGRLRADSFYYMVIGRDLAAGQPYFYKLEHYLFPVFHMRPPLLSGLFALSFQWLGVSVTSALIVAKILTFGMIVSVFLLTTALYNKWTGLMSVGVVIGSSYLVGYTAHIEIDPAVTGIMLLAVFFMVLFLQRQSNAFAVMAGLGIGLAILTKEIAVMLAPLPIYLFLSIKTWRKRGNVSPLASYSLSGAAVVLIYVAYYFSATGRVFLVARAFEGLSWSQISASVAVLAAIGGIVVVLLLRFKQGIIRGYLRHEIWVAPALAIVLAGMVTYILAIAFGQNSAWIRSPLEIPARLLGIWRWFTVQAIPRYTLFALVTPAGLIWIINFAIKRHSGDLALLWLCVCLMPLLLTFSPNEATLRVARYGFPLFMVASMLIARAAAIVAELAANLLSPSKSRLATKLLPATAITIFALGATNLVLLPSQYDYNGDVSHPLTFNTSTVKQTAAWIEENIPSTANIGSSNRYIAALDFYTTRERRYERIYSWDGDQTGIAWPINTTTALRQNEDQLQFQDIARRNITVTNPVFIQYSIWPTFQQRTSATTAPLYYLTMSEDELHAVIERENLDYLVLSSGNADQNMFGTLPQYFVDNAAFEIVSKVTWPDDAGSRTFNLYVVKLDRTKLRDTDYPLEISTLRNAWPALKQQITASRPDDSSALCHFLEDVAGGSLFFTPSSTANSQYYREIGDNCMLANKSDLAAYQYYLAVRDNPTDAQRIAPFAQRLMMEEPLSPEVLLLQGNLQLLGNEWDAAQASFDRALALPSTSEHTRSALHQAIGRLASARGDYASAHKSFTAAQYASTYEAALNDGFAQLAQAVADHNRVSPANNLLALSDIQAIDFAQTIELYSQILRDPLLQHSLVGPIEDFIITELVDLDITSRKELVSAIQRIDLPAIAQPVVAALVEQYVIDGNLNTLADEGAYFALAELASSISDYEGAEQLYDTAIKLWPDHSAGYRLRGRLLFDKMNNVAASVRDLQQAIKLAPHDKESYLALMEVFDKTQQPSQSTALLKAAIERNPDATWPLELAGNYYIDSVWTLGTDTQN